MGWIEQRPDGNEIDHDYRLADERGQLVQADLDHIELPVAGRARPDLRAACTCGWISAEPGPTPPAPSSADVAFWCDFGQWRPGTAPHGWTEYLLRSWQTHVGSIIPGTSADDPVISPLCGIMAVLDDVRAHPTRSLHTLASIRDTLASATVLAIAAAEANGVDAAMIARLLRVEVEQMPAL